MSYLKIAGGWVDIELPLSIVGHVDDLVLDGVVSVDVSGVHLGNSPPGTACLDHHWGKCGQDGGVVVEVVEVHLNMKYEPE